jgi:HEAT repeat protein
MRRTSPAFVVVATLAIPAGGCLGRETGTRPASPPPAPAPARDAGRTEPPPSPDTRDARSPASPSGGAEGRGRDRERLIYELDSQDPNRVYFAAISLLSEWSAAPDDPTAIRAIAARLQGSRPEQQRTLVKAIGHFTTYPGPSEQAKLRAVKDLVPLLEPFLGHQDRDLRRDAIDALATLDALAADDPASDEVDALIRRTLGAGSKHTAPLEAQLDAVRLIGRKPPKKAVPRLIDVIERFPRSTEVQAVAYEELYGVTGIDFHRDLFAAKRWWEKNRERRPEDWYRERFKKFEEEIARKNRAYRDLWAERVRSLGNDPKVFSYLKDSLLGPVGAECPQVRAEAAEKLAAIGRPEAFDALVEALGNEKDPEATRSILAAIATMATTPPAEDPEALARALRAITPLLTGVERDVRLAAIEAIAALGLDDGVRSLVERLQGKDRDPETAAAVLKALARIGARSSPRVTAEINRFLRAELDREPLDPLREPRLFAECARALSALAERKEIPPASDEAIKALENLRDLLRYKYEDPTNPVSVNTRQLAALALGKLGLRAGLPYLYDRLSEKNEPDESVAQYAAAAIGEIASGPDCAGEERARALARLREAFDARRDPKTKDALFKALLAIVKADSGTALSTFEDLAEKLAQGGDPARVAKLLECLPERPAAGQEARYYALREKQARAYEAAKDYKSAIDVWNDLAARDPRHRLALANALGLAGKYDDADRIYQDQLLRSTAPAEVQQAWVGRQGLIRKLIDAQDPAQAIARAKLMLAGQGALAPPPETVAAIRVLMDEALRIVPVEKAPADGERRPGTPLPGSLPGGQAGSGEGARLGPGPEERRR